MSDSDIRNYLARAATEERRARTADSPTIRAAHARFANAYRAHVYASMPWRGSRSLSMTASVPNARAPSAAIVGLRGEPCTRDAVSA